MRDWERELDAIRRRMLECAGRDGALRRWQDDAEARIPASDWAALEQALEPADVPAEHRAVFERVTADEFAWEDVMAGDLADDDARALSMDMDRRLHQLEQVGRLVRTGTALDAAIDQVLVRGAR